MTTVKEVLIQAKQKILKPEQWTQGALWRDKNGGSLMVKEENATCFCMMGAMLTVCHNVVDDKLRWKAEDILSDILPSRDGIAHYNDTPGRTHEEVLAMFDKAIEAAS